MFAGSIYMLQNSELVYSADYRVPTREPAVQQNPIHLYFYNTFAVFPAATREKKWYEEK